MNSKKQDLRHIAILSLRVFDMVVWWVWWVVIEGLQMPWRVLTDSICSCQAWPLTIRPHMQAAANCQLGGGSGGRCGSLSQRNLCGVSLSAPPSDTLLPALDRHPGGVATVSMADDMNMV